MTNYNFSALEKVELNPIVRRLWFFTFFIVLFLVGMLFLPWQQTVKGEGLVMAYDPTERDYSVLATIDGFIEKFHVEENQFVTKGTALFTMVDLDKSYLEKLEKMERSTQEQYENAQKIILKSKEQQENEKKYLTVGLTVYEQKEHQSEDKIESFKLKKISLEKNYEIERSNFNRTKLLYNDGIESKRNYEKAEDTLAKAKAEVGKIDIDIEIEKTTIKILQQEKEKFVKQTENKIKSLENTLLSAKNQLKSFDQSLQTQSTTIARYATSEVVAPKDGYVVRLLSNDKNKFIKKGEAVIHFSPKVDVKSVRLKVSDFNMPLIKEGLPARIMFYGWPALQISGWPQIKFGTFGGIIKKVEPLSHEKGFYYAHIVENPNEPWPSDELLRIGTQSTVWVRLSTVPLWYQLWRLMNALPPQMVTPVLKVD